MREISPPPGFDPRTVQPLGSRYTDYATRLTETEVLSRINQEYLTDRKTSRMADLTVWLSDTYHIVSFTLEVKEID